MMEEEKCLTELNHLVPEVNWAPHFPARVESWERHRWEFLGFFDAVQA